MARLLFAATALVLLAACGGASPSTSNAAAKSTATACPSPGQFSPRPRPSGAPTGGGFGNRAPGTIGTVTAVKGGQLTVQERRTGQPVVVDTDGSTQVRVNGAGGKLGDVKVGDTVVVMGAQQPDGSVLATTIQVQAGGGCFAGRRGAGRPSPTPTSQTS